MSKHSSSFLNGDGLILSGYQKKLKTMKKKYFVLFKDTLSNAARLEYYDNEKKFKSRMAPKRVIKLKTCFNINRRLDTKYDFVIALSTKDGSFGIVLETEDEMFKWLEMLISLQHCSCNIPDSLQPQYEHVWQVLVQKKGLAEDNGIFGNYHVGLTQRSLTLVRIGPEKTNCGSNRKSKVEFLLTTIRRCGDSQCVFYMEVGRQSVLGPGELWMETEDTLIAQNMHYMILSAMSTKSELNVEPMRKRSSSANEASKPVNVLHRKQIHSENVNVNSPHSNSYFGRDRCDSLPSRNRTSSDCCKQNMTAASTLNIRNASISGLRLHPYQRKSSSPPINSIVGFSESEESSISFDEAEDTGALMSYRFKSRSSKGVIPEENSDELAYSDLKGTEKPIEMICDSCFQIEDQTDENYVSMAPVKSSKELLNSSDDANYLPSTFKYKHASDILFPEYTSDISGLVMNLYEGYCQSELPTRTYSIGNRVEYNIKRSIGNSNEADQNVTRVRAFSVGSRAKIPRCDLQHGALFLKSSVKSNVNSSNNNVSSTDDAAAVYNQLLNINIDGGKKSTSAPLLIHKSHNSMNRMSDLMELDFSKNSSSFNKNATEIIQSQLIQCGVNSNHEKNRKSETEVDQLNFEELPKYLLSTSSSADCKSVIKTDNGYLEMKPISYLLPRNSAANLIGTQESKNSVNTSKAVVSNDATPEVRNTQTSVESKRKSFTKLLQNKTVSSMVGNQCIKQDNLLQCEENKVEDFSESSRLCNHESKESMLSDKYAQLSLKSMERYKAKTINDDDHTNIDKTCNANMYTSIRSNPNNPKTNEPTQIISKNLSYTAEDIKNCTKKSQRYNTGYEILQIKSDSSLQSHKTFYQESKIRKDKQFQSTQIRPWSTNNTSLSVSPVNSPSTLCGCTSVSTSCLNFIPVPNAQITASKELIDTTNLTKEAQVKLNVVSRPPSVSSEHELYYASLDLPQCSAHVNTKTNKSDNLTDSAIYKVDVKNSYAKIDFDHSDSSSSASRI